MVASLNVRSIEEAAREIDPVFRDSPQFVDPHLAHRVGRELVLKLETLNPVRSFKGRGADHLLRGLDSDRRVVCASAGNFGLAMAYAGRARGVAVTVFCARTANPLKVAAIRGLGVEVVRVGADFDAAKEAARAYAAEEPSRLFVEDGREPAVTEGAGTIAVELAALRPDVVLVPVGNGALISGIGCWTKSRAPGTRIVGVCAEGAPAMAESWRRGEPVTWPEARTAADGVAVRVPVPEAVEWMRELVDDVVLVSEEQLGEALRVLRDTVGLLVEPAGALGVAAALHHRFPEGTLATVVTGSNFSADLRAELTGGASPASPASSAEPTG